MKKINETPFELVGFKYQDYQNWCKEKNLKESNKTKKEFFGLVLNYKLIKKNGIVIDLTKENI